MASVYSLAALAGIVLFVTYLGGFRWKAVLQNRLFTLLLLGVATRLLAIRFVDYAYDNDLNCFKLWSMRLYEGGFAHFYTSEIFTDYPPGYMYILYVIGFIRSIFNLDYDGLAFRLLVMSPAMLCDMLTGVFLYKLSSRKMKPDTAWLIGLVYLLNPAVLVNSSVWGQVDSVYTLILLGSVYFIVRKKHLPAFLLFAAAFLIKPQSLIFTPLYLYAVYAHVFVEDRQGRTFFHTRRALELLRDAGITLLFIGISVLPFSTVSGISPVISQYRDTLGSYPYAVLNAFNFYAFVGANWLPLSDRFLGVSYQVYGFVFLVAIVLLSIYLLHRSRKNQADSNYFFIAGLLNTLTFMLSVKMHERYLYPSMVFFLAAYLYRREKKFLLLHGGFSLTLFVNCIGVLSTLRGENMNKTMPLFSALNLILTGVMIYTAFMAYPKDAAEPEITVELPEKHGKYPEGVPLERSEPLSKMTKKDYGLAAGLMLIYGIIAFVRLGDMEAPQTVWDPGKDEAIAVFQQEETVTKLQAMLGPKENQSFSLWSSQDGETWEFQQEISLGSVFAWKDIDLVPFTAKAVKITPVSNQLMILEMAFRNGEDIIPIAEGSPGAETLFDEQQLVPDKSDFMNSTYFDEIYHARTAYELLNHTAYYEWTHPPLGKVIISIGVSLFGMTPFGWRFMGTVFGIAMIFLVYCFAKKMFKKTEWALLAGIFISCDFMHFSQTRIATIDTYVTFFIIGMYYFMYLYYSKSFYDTKLHKTLLPLLGSGICFGLAAACKWPGIYAAAGLAILFFYTLYKRYREYRNPQNAGDAQVTRVFARNTVITLACCVVFFVIIPAAVYIASYYSFLQTPGKQGLLSIWENQKSMFGYHSGLTEPHPYESPWWQWPFIARPIFYFSSTVSETVRAGISSLGNPAVWWGGLAALFALIWKNAKKFDKKIVFLLVAFSAQFFPWVLISRSTFIYHYFPSVPFIVLSLVYAMHLLFGEKKMKMLFAYAGLAVLLFALFYPVLSGLPVAVSYVRIFLEWMTSWQLV